jgi:uroporphyrinogen-III decarboxylase
MMTKWIPRSFGKLNGLSEFPAMRGSMWYGWLGTVPPFANSPDLWNALETLKKAGEEISRWFASLDQYKQEIKVEGFPIAYGGWAFAPFDLLGDTLRGVRGIFPDMIQQPDKLIEAVEKMVPIAIEGGSVAAEANDPPMAWIWLHKGSDEFMSIEQFKTFYWPSLKKLICGLIDNGVIPVVYGEGNETSRLEYYTEIPKGKAIFHFATTDIFKAKDILKDVACISGNLPNSLMVTGTPDDVKEYCRKLIDYCGKDGGYIMDTSALLDEAKPENVSAMFEFTREYGIYG